MPPLRSSRRHYVFGLSVRTSRSRDRVIWRTDRWIPAKLWSCMYLAEPMNWLDFGSRGQRSKVTWLIMYAKTARDRVIWRTDRWIPAKLWSCMYLAEPMNWLDFGVTRSKVKGHMAHYVCKNSSWSRYLKNRLMDSCQTLVMYVSCRADELIRFWGHEVKGQRSQGSLCMQKQLVIALSQEPIDGFLPNLDHVCYL